MNILADECVDQEIVHGMRQAGHDVFYIAETTPGQSDEEILDIANQNRCLLVTSDKDFGELVFRRQLLSAGVLLLRLSGLSHERKAAIIVSTLQEHSLELIEAFTVHTPGTLRIRHRHV